MAGLDAPLSRGAFSSLARMQYRALAEMRWSMFRNSLRSTRGAIELGARTVAYLLYSLLGLALTVGFGFGAYFIAASAKWSVMAILLWSLFVMWQFVPVMLASLQERFDLGTLLRFPLGFGTYCVLHLVFGLVDASTIMGCLCSFGIWIGIVVERPDLFAWAGFILLVSAVFNVLLVRTIAAWIDRWLAQRRTREIVGALFFVALLSLQLLNPAFWRQNHPRMRVQSHAVVVPYLNTVDRVQRWMPPGLAAYAIGRSGESHPVPAMEAIGLLGIYALAVGGVLGLRLRGEYRGENFSEAPARQKAERPARAWPGEPADKSSSVGWMLIQGSGPLAAIMEKEFRVLMRAMPLLYGLAAPLLMAFVLSGLFVRHGTPGGHAMSMSFLVSIAYAMVGFTQLFYNNLGPDGPGIQVLFLAPTPMRTVMLAKNLFHALLLLVDAVLVCVITALRIGWPPPVAIAATAAWLLFALPVHLAAGNAFSLVMPYRMNLGRMTRQRGSQGSALLSMLIQLAVLGLGAAIFAVCSFFGRLWIAVPVLLALAIAAILAWIRELDQIDTMASRRRELLIATLARTE